MTGTDVVDTTEDRGPGVVDAAEDRGQDAPDAGAPLLEKPRWRDRIPTGRVALKIAVAVAGLLVVAVGALLIPLPGPGWLIVLGGLGIWAIEFSWARRLLGFTRRNLRLWTRWVTRQSWAAS